VETAKQQTSFSVSYKGSYDELTKHPVLPPAKLLSSYETNFEQPLVKTNPGMPITPGGTAARQKPA
jgi:hypothetical protein